jgi:rubrerythrin
MEKTKKNLAMAFVGESQARNRYTMYAKMAKQDGYPQIEKIFLETAENEREHAKWFFRMLNELKEKGCSCCSCDMVHIETDVPTTLGDTIANLRAAIEGENEEHTKLYPQFADDADAEGFPAMAARIRAISKVEEHHEARYKALLEQVTKGTMFEKDCEVEWKCDVCGYVHKGKKPPAKCPSCSHPTEYYVVLCEKF